MFSLQCGCKMMDESVPQIGVVAPPKTTNKIEYSNRHNILPYTVPIQVPKYAAIPLYPNPLEVIDNLKLVFIDF